MRLPEVHGMEAGTLAVRRDTGSAVADVYNRIIVEKVFATQADLKRLYYLWQIYHIKQEISSAQSTAAEQFGELREAAIQLQSTEKEIEKMRKQQAGFSKDAVKQEHQMKRRRAEFEKQVL